ncbi:Conserved hypothetical protein [Clostridium neonatale]|nr:Conserved hypothetical protein [Clostridium neonatale]
MKKKKIVKLLGPVAGIMSFMLLTGVFTTSAFADQVSTSSTAITQNSTKDYKKIINKSVEQNGVKVTLLDVVATKHKIKANIKLECSKGLQDEKKNGLFVQGIYNMQESWGGGQGTSNIDDNTLIVEIEDECEDNSEYKSNGDYRLDIVVPYYKVNIGMNIPVDFTSEFAKVKENEVSIYVKDLDVNIKKVESDILGTNIYYTQKSQNYSNSDFDNEVHDPIVLLKVGDKIYVANSYGGANWGSYNEDNDLEYRTYYSKDATYDKVTNTDAISIIPISNDITYNESNKFYDEKYKDGYEVNEEDYTTEQSVSFVKEFDFSDKSKGEIYKIERDNDIVKLYCKGNSKEKSLLMASTMDIYPKYDENEQYYYDEDYYKTIYKDKNDDNGYVVEFTNVDKDRNMIVGIDDLIQFSDRYKFGEEIKLK